MWCVLCALRLQVTLLHIYWRTRVHVPSSPLHRVEICAHSNYIKSSHITHLLAIFQSFCCGHHANTILFAQYAAVLSKTKRRNCVAVAPFFISIWYVMMFVRTPHFKMSIDKGKCAFVLVKVNTLRWHVCLLWLCGCDCAIVSNTIRSNKYCTDKCCRSQKHDGTTHSLTHSNVRHILAEFVLIMKFKMISSFFVAHRFVSMRNLFVFAFNRTECAGF